MALEFRESTDSWIDDEIKTVEGVLFEIPRESARGLNAAQFRGLLSRHIQEGKVNLTDFLSQLDHIRKMAKEQSEVLYRNNFYLNFSALYREAFINDNPHLPPEIIAQFKEDDPVLGLLKTWDKEGNREKLELFKQKYPELWKAIFDFIHRVWPLQANNVSKLEDIIASEWKETREDMLFLKELMREADEKLQEVGIDTSDFAI